MLSSAKTFLNFISSCERFAAWSQCRTLNDLLTQMRSSSRPLPASCVPTFVRSLIPYLRSLGAHSSGADLVKKQDFDVPGLYDPRGAYRFVGGTNWRAVVTLIVSIGPNFPGMINGARQAVPATAQRWLTPACDPVLHPSTKIGNIKWIYSVSWCFGFIVSVIVSLHDTLACAPG